MREITPIGPHVALFPEVGLDGEGDIILLLSTTEGALLARHYQPDLTQALPIWEPVEEHDALHE
jgi:hypothetical protein